MAEVPTSGKGPDMNRQKVTLRANGELLQLARQIGDSMGVSTAGVVDRLLLAGLQQWAAGTIDFDGYLEPTAQGRYAWTVLVEPDGLGGRVRKRLAEDNSNCYVAEGGF
jgi:hypothetical protein